MLNRFLISLFCAFIFTPSLYGTTGEVYTIAQNDIPPPPTDLLPPADGDGDGEPQDISVDNGGDQNAPAPPPPVDVPPPLPDTPPPPSDNNQPETSNTRKDITNPYLSELSENNLYARFTTNLGTFVVRLWGRQAPQSVANFIGLSMGTKVFTEISGKKVRRPFYDGLIFHKISGKSTLHTGCPFGNGTGGPGFQIQDELENGLSFDKPYQLAYANYGPNTSGSQLFINAIPRPDLNNGFTVFGTIIENQDVVNKIANVEVNALERPIRPIIIEKVEIYKQQ